MVEEVRLLKIEVSPLQLAEWLIHGLAVIIALLQVDSVNDRTRWPIPRASRKWERTRNIQEGRQNFSAPHSTMFRPIAYGHRRSRPRVAKQATPQTYFALVG